MFVRSRNNSTAYSAVNNNSPPNQFGQSVGVDGGRGHSGLSRVILHFAQLGLFGVEVLLLIGNLLLVVGVFLCEAGRILGAARGIGVELCRFHTIFALQQFEFVRGLGNFLVL